MRVSTQELCLNQKYQVELQITTPATDIDKINITIPFIEQHKNL